MSRKGQLWRGELAQHIEEYLEGEAREEEFIDWALDHPFFDDHSDLDAVELSLIGMGLGRILQRSAAEPFATRTTDAQLREAMLMLWGTLAGGAGV